MKNENLYPPPPPPRNFSVKTAELLDSRSRVHAVAVAAFALLFMAGCGGGGSGSVNMAPPGGDGSGGSGSISMAQTGLNNLSPAIVAEASARVADARPRAGSVTQSSNTLNNVTLDRVSVTVQHGTGRNSYSIQNGSSWSISTSDVDPVDISSQYWDGQELDRRINGGTISVDVYSDIEAPTTTSTPNTDYLAAGVWVFYPDGATQFVGEGGVVLGAFGDGSDPFRQSALMALQGTARYAGGATGIYSEVGFWSGNVNLTADFGGQGDLGSIDGSITGIRTGDERVSGSVSLGTANIGSLDSGFFDGELSSNLNGVGLNGRWGGQFFGNSEADGKPGAVVGTLGAASQDRTVGLVGAFGARRDRDP